MSLKTLWDTVSTTMENCIRYLAIVSIALSTLMVCWEVFTRYVIGISTDWVAAASKYLVICVALLMAGPLTRSDEHIAFTFIASRLRGRAQQISKFAAILSGLCVSIFMLIYSLKITLMLKEWGQTSESGGFKMWWIYSFMVASMVLIALYYFEMFVSWFVPVVKRQEKKGK